MGGGGSGWLATLRPPSHPHISPQFGEGLEKVLPTFPGGDSSGPLQASAGPCEGAPSGAVSHTQGRWDHSWPEMARWGALRGAGICLGLGAWMRLASQTQGRVRCVQPSRGTQNRTHPACWLPSWPWGVQEGAGLGSPLLERSDQEGEQRCQAVPAGAGEEQRQGPSCLPPGQPGDQQGLAFSPFLRSC